VPGTPKKKKDFELSQYPLHRVTCCACIAIPSSLPLFLIIATTEYQTIGTFSSFSQCGRGELVNVFEEQLGLVEKAAYCPCKGLLEEKRVVVPFT